MLKLTILPLALIACASLQPLSLHAQDQDQGKKDGMTAGDDGHGGGKALKDGKSAQKDVERSSVSGPGISRGPATKSKSVDVSRFTDAGSLGDSNTKESVRQTNRNQSSASRSNAFVVRGNQSNHYNGQWVSAETHSDWDQHSVHSWNHRQYRYYDGGWLLVDLGSSPVDYGSGSTGSSVQASLAQQGYYHGPIDGEIGPGTHRAIAHYQVDNGLAVSGQIDGPLLASLGLN
jgi:hypothetical protein